MHRILQISSGFSISRQSLGGKLYLFRYCPLGTLGVDICDIQNTDFIDHDNAFDVFLCLSKNLQEALRFTRERVLTTEAVPYQEWRESLERSIICTEQAIHANQNAEHKSLKKPSGAHQVLNAASVPMQLLKED